MSRGTQSDAEAALRRLEAMARQSPTDSAAFPRSIPDDLATDEHQVLYLSPSEWSALGHTEEAILEDLRFEHLGKTASDAVWDFFCRAHLNRSVDHVSSFVGEHGREPLDRVCYVAVLNLSVESAIEVLGLRLLPPDDPRVPRPHGSDSLDPSAESVAAVEVRGTRYANMGRRAKRDVTRRLRVLRIALRSHPFIAHEQLRFRVGRTYAFEDRITGWQRSSEEPFGLGLNDELVRLAEAHVLAGLAGPPTNRVEERLDIAFGWVERASFAGEPLVELLFLFFALEALLGDTSEGLKGPRIALRQAILEHSVTGAFAHPSSTLLLYDRVRSKAVHGDVVAVHVEEATLRRFRSRVTRTLSHYRTFARTHEITKSATLRKRLDEHPDRDQFMEWIRKRGGPGWTKLLADHAAASRQEGPNDSAFHP